MATMSASAAVIRHSSICRLVPPCKPRQGKRCPGCHPDVDLPLAVLAGPVTLAEMLSQEVWTMTAMVFGVAYLMGRYDCLHTKKETNGGRPPLSLCFHQNSTGVLGIF
jgi:hypothetical protein